MVVQAGEGAVNQERLQLRYSLDLSKRYAALSGQARPLLWVQQVVLDEAFANCWHDHTKCRLSPQPSKSTEHRS